MYSIFKVSLRIVCVTLILTPSFILAQEDRNDFNTWTALELSYEGIENWDFSFETQLRLKENSATVDKYFGELGIQYKLPHNFNIGAGLRYIRDNDNQGNIQGYENHLRFNFDLSFRHSVDRLRLKYRLRYQNRDELDVNDDLTNQRFRLKTTALYNFRDWKLDPQLSGELFNRIGTSSDKNGIDRYRIGLGSSYKMNKSGKLSLFYFYEDEIDMLNPASRHIVRLKYSYSIK